MAMSSGLLILVISIVGGVWLVRTTGAQLLAFVLIAGLAVSVPWTLDQMKTYKYQSVEGNFVHALTSGDSQEGTRNRSGQVVGFDQDLAMADFITKNVSARASVLADNSTTYGVIVLTGHPELFFDRIDRGDGPWLKARNDPPASVQYLLISHSEKDLLRRAYPDAATGNDARLPVAYSNDRYTLVKVPASFTPDLTATTTTPGSNS